MSAAKIEQLLKKRSILVLQLKKHFSQSLEFNEESDIEEVTAQTERLVKMWPRFEDVNEQLENKDPNFHEIVSENYDLEDLESKVRVHLRKITQKMVQPSVEKEEVHDFRDDEDEIKLPPVNIKPFSGAANEWIPFRDMFLGLVHERDTMRPVKKMHYLKLYTTGEAADAIKHMPIDAEHYGLAWKRLEDRYHNPRILIDGYLDRFFNQPTVPLKNAMGIRRLIDITNETLHMIEKLGADTANWDPVFVHVLLNKIDCVTQQQWKEKLKASKNLVKLNEFLEFLETRYHVLDETMIKSNNNHANKFNGHPNNNQRENNNKNGHQQKFAPFRALATNTYPCPFCKLNHQPYNCEKLKTSDNKEKLK